MRPGTIPLNDDEIRMLQEAQAIQQLRDSLAFRKVYNAIKVAVDQAHSDLEVNTNPHADAYYKLIWQSRKHLLECIDGFIDSTIQKRRDAVQEFFRAVGVSEDLIAKNLDNPLDFLASPNTIGGPYRVNNTNA